MKVLLILNDDRDWRPIVCAPEEKQELFREYAKAQADVNQRWVKYKEREELDIKELDSIAQAGFSVSNLLHSCQSVLAEVAINYGWTDDEWFDEYGPSFEFLDKSLQVFPPLFTVSGIEPENYKATYKGSSIPGLIEFLSNLPPQFKLEGAIEIVAENRLAKLQLK